MAPYPASIWDSNSTTPSWYDIDVRGGRPLPSLSEHNLNHLHDPAAHHGSLSGKKDLSSSEAWYYAVKSQERDEELREKLVKLGYIKDHDYGRGNAFAAQAEAAKKEKLREREAMKNARTLGYAARDLYYEYMFVDAELEAAQAQSANSDEQLSCGESTDEDEKMEDFLNLPDVCDDVATPSDRLPLTPTSSTYAESILQVGQYDQPVGQLIESDLSHTKSVYGVTTEELDLSTRSLLFTGLQFLDARSGNEDFPSNQFNFAYPQGNEQTHEHVFVDAMPNYESDSMSETSTAAPYTRSVLVPKSQKEKAIRTIAQQAQKASERAAEFVTAFASLDSTPAEAPVKISRTPSVEFIKVVKKRAYRYSTLSDAFWAISDEDKERLGNKKLRTSLHAQLQDAEAEMVPHFRESIIDITVMDHKTESRIVSQDFFHRNPLPTPPKGYPGQFDGMVIDNDNKAVFGFQFHTPFPKSNVTKMFGFQGHPNGLFTHTAYTEDPICEDPDFEHGDLPYNHPLRNCMNFANDMTEAAAHSSMAELRTYEEETFRREVHLECSSARLEGCAVGTWRYYEGSYSLAEYKSASICICWDDCQCSKMCTRYGDLKCPCGEDVIVHGDDD